MSQQQRITLDWGKKTYLMGILNITPDSFSGDTIMNEADPIAFAVNQATQFVAEGADILDIGAESSRPGSQPITAEEELKRLIPVIKALKQANLPAILSIDTYKARVAAKCLDMGADWINDIWGLQGDPELAPLIAKEKVPVVLMHNRSQSGAVKQDKRLGSSYDAGKYTNFMQDLIAELTNLTSSALHAGIQREKIILDPGIGFGKTVEQNLEIVNCLNRIRSIGYPVLIGPSRKSFIGNVLDLPVEERVEGTAAAIAVGIMRGADIVRVHDVKVMARVSKMTDALKNAPCTRN